MSSVTAVPLQPLPKGTVLKLWLGILLVLLLALGLAWLGTTKLQFSRTDTGLSYRVIEEGTGDTIGPDDLVQLHFEISRANGEVLNSTVRSGEPVAVTINNFPLSGLRSMFLVMREGGVYEAHATPEEATGEPVPPGTPLTPGEQLRFQFRVIDVAPGMGAMQGMMGPGGAGGPGGPGGPPPGALPPGAMPPGSAPPGAGPAGPPPGPGGQ